MRKNTMFEIKILKTAWNDIERIVDLHMALSGPNSVRTVTDGILNSIEKLKDFPSGFPTVPEDEMSEAGYRMVIYKQYLSIYRIIDDIVYIYRVVDGRKNYPKLFRGFLEEER